LSPNSAAVLETEAELTTERTRLHVRHESGEERSIGSMACKRIRTLQNEQNEHTAPVDHEKAKILLKVVIWANMQMMAGGSSLDGIG
jgi:hypothetical protein